MAILVLRPSQLRATAAESALLIPYAIALGRRYHELTLPVVLTTHHAILVVQALWNALVHRPPPVIFHSDNGREYDSAIFRSILADFGIVISRSAPGCPWENGYQESFYDKFKLDLGDPNRFATLGELVAEIYRTVHAYNTTRIHLALKMPPAEFAKLRGGDIIKTTVDFSS